MCTGNLWVVDQGGLSLLALGDVEEARAFCVSLRWCLDGAVTRCVFRLRGRVVRQNATIYRVRRLGSLVYLEMEKEPCLFE